MTDDERKLLENTARSMLRLVEEQKDAVAGIEAALLEIYRAQSRIDLLNYQTVARLRLRLKILQSGGSKASFLAQFIRKLES